MNITISGSLRKHLEIITKYRNEFIQLGHSVLSPVSGEKIGEEDGFVILANDVGTVKHIEEKHLKAIAKSDLLYLICNEGYIGPSTAMEIGYANALSIPIFSNCQPNERVFSEMVSVVEPKDIICKQADDCLDNLILRNISVSLTDIQDLIQQQSVRLGFDNETTQQLILMAVEEIGELAAIERRRSGLIAAHQRNKDFAGEIADLLIYTISIANNEKVCIQKSLLEKMSLNEKRFPKV